MIEIESNAEIAQELVASLNFQYKCTIKTYKIF